MDSILLNIAVIIAAYLMGSISSAIIVCRMVGLPDPRSAGSNNPGATNVLRLGSKGAAAATLMGDLLKGLIPLLIAKGLGLTGWGLALTAIAPFLGHLYPIFFQFKGGKGVATAFGIILGLNLYVGLAAFAVWLGIFITTRISSLSALTAAATAPLFLWLFKAEGVVVFSVLFMVLLLIYRHKSNIVRLLSGDEKRF